MKAADYVEQIMRTPGRTVRAAMLERVPRHMRDRVRAEVEWRWRERTRNTRNRQR